jgi:hypothetical protein
VGAEQAARDAAVAQGLRVAEALLADLSGSCAELAPRREGDPVQPPSSAPAFEALHEGVVAAVLGRAFTALARARGLEPAGGRLLQRAARAEEALTECAAHLAALSRDFEACAALWPIDALGTLFEALIASEWSADASGVRRRESRARKRHGRWFTPPALTAEVTRRALAGLRSELELLDAAAQAQRIECFTACDPALCAAAFLLETARQVLALHPEHGAAG